MSNPGPLSNPFSGKFYVESLNASPDGMLWETLKEYPRGTYIWTFRVRHIRKTAAEYEGVLSGYGGKGKKAGFLWKPAEAVLMIDQTCRSPFGYSDIFNETYRVEFSGDGKIILTCDEDGIPSFRWVLEAI